MDGIKNEVEAQYSSIVLHVPIGRGGGTVNSQDLGLHAVSQASCGSYDVSDNTQPAMVHI